MSPRATTQVRGNAPWNAASHCLWLHIRAHLQAPRESNRRHQMTSTTKCMTILSMGHTAPQEVKEWQATTRTHCHLKHWATACAENLEHVGVLALQARGGASQTLNDYNLSCRLPAADDRGTPPVLPYRPPASTTQLLLDRGIRNGGVSKLVCLLRTDSVAHGACRGEATNGRNHVDGESG